MIELNEAHARDFLAKNKIKNCEIKKIAGDASFRSYYRIFAKGKNTEKTYILMFAPPGFEDVKPFAKIDEFLVSCGFSAPKIFAKNIKKGFLLLEDLNDDTYGRILAKTPSAQLKNLELDLYQKACDCLLELHSLPALEGLPNYNHALLFREVMLFVDWYLPMQKKTMSLQDRARFKSLWFELFDLLGKEKQTLVLRDYHADNLMILPDRKGFKQVGLLDFQDAVIGSRAYDLVSLLEDARRDVNEENASKLLEYYLQKSDCDKSAFIRDYEILSLQRNLKIVGIFSRLSVRDGKHNYLDLLPRVLNFVKQRTLSKNQIFFEIGNLLKKFL